MAATPASPVNQDAARVWYSIYAGIARRPIFLNAKNVKKHFYRRLTPMSADKVEHGQVFLLISAIPHEISCNFSKVVVNV